MKKMITAVFATGLALSSLHAVAGDMPSTVTVGGGSPSNTMNQLTSFISNQLANNRNIKNVSDSRIAVASFVNLTNLSEADKFGVALAENLMHEMHLRGFGIVDFKVMDSLRVRHNGDYVFSRDIKELRQQYNIHYFLSGTVSKNADGAVINARLIQADNNILVSTAQGFVPNRDLAKLVGDYPQPAVEKVVVERPVIPAVRENIVNIR